MKVKGESEVAQSCPTLSDPMDCSLTGSSAHGIFQARVLEWDAYKLWVSSYIKPGVLYQYISFAEPVEKLPGAKVDPFFLL